MHIPTQWASSVKLKGLEIESDQVVGAVGNNKEFYFFTDHTNNSRGYSGNRLYFKNEVVPKERVT